MVKSVDRALTIVSLVSQKKEGVRVTELASQLDLNKSSIFRLLATLVRHGYVEQDSETKKYKLGYKPLELSAILLESIDLRSQAKTFLKELETITNEVIHLVLFNDGEVIYIEKLEGNETLRTHSRVGRRAPLHCTSVGKVILANLTESEVNDLLERNGMPKHTENTITDKESFMVELKKIRNQGYGIESEENEPGITCLAAPIFNNEGDITAAVSISGPSIRMADDRLEELKSYIISTGEKISSRLGFQNGVK
ncbi:DNA-binding IclR family transcriptional regulator [Neobacillus niacini]|uniref:IclR family transcriptional regulator n=1 Tax=Neobacillus niacini TaxID=86668 RepID=UPI00285E20BC|nr:IclR family transcriptional regulator [Neobacillus niacini]MDR7079752.1 DNA-binding IclR family transcriptional regulator [Neobacillus niacini]